MLTTAEIAWTAGIFEGEGSCRPSLHERTGITATVTQKDRWLVERLRSLYGGSIGQQWSELNGTRSLINYWHVHGARARGLLMTIYSLLSPWRQAQVRIALLRTSRTSVPSPWKGLCVRGHELTPENTYIDPKGWRTCRECRRIRWRTGYRPRHPGLVPAEDLARLPPTRGSRLLRSPEDERAGPITTIEIAWAAGVFEGEGSCQPSAKGKRHRILASVTQKDRWMLERLQAMFGGTFGTARSRLHGKDYVTPRWYVTGPRARGFLMTIYVFLSPRRRAQVRAALERTSGPIATADHCRRGHAVATWAAYQRGGRYCRACKNAKSRERYSNDPSYREQFLRRLKYRRAERIASGVLPDLAIPTKPRSDRCRKGHLFTTENTIANRSRGRQCRNCWNDWHREWDRKRRARPKEAREHRDDWTLGRARNSANTARAR